MSRKNEWCDLFPAASGEDRKTCQHGFTAAGNEGVQKEATRAQEQVLLFLSLQTHIQRRLLEEIPVSRLWEQTPSDDVECSTIIALTCWASGNLNRSECCTFWWLRCGSAWLQSGGQGSTIFTNTTKINTQLPREQPHNHLCLWSFSSFRSGFELVAKTFVLVWTLTWWTV